MSNSDKYEETPENFADRALELLEQAYAYYDQPLRTVATGDNVSQSEETYYEYVKAA